MKLIPKPLMVLAVTACLAIATGAGVVANADELLDIYAHHSLDFQTTAQKVINTLSAKGYQVGELELEHYFGQIVLEAETYKDNMQYKVVMNYPSLDILSELPDGYIDFDDGFYGDVHHKSAPDHAALNTPAIETADTTGTSMSAPDFHALHKQASEILGKQGYQIVDIDLDHEYGNSILDIDATKDGMAYDIKMSYPQLNIISTLIDNT